jgi:hypothetical protein
MYPQIENSDSEWEIVVYTDSDRVGDKETRISIIGFIVFLLAILILWKSKGQRSVSLSSSEAEYYTPSEAAKEIKCITHILLTMGIPVHLPIIVRVDNVSTISMWENVSASSRTKHVDIRYSFVREFVVDKFIKNILPYSSLPTIIMSPGIFTINTAGRERASYVEANG